MHVSDQSYKLDTQAYNVIKMQDLTLQLMGFWL